jgi:hypothetical protein
MIKYGTKEFQEVGVLLEKAKETAIEYRALTEKPLGITSEVAEYEAAKWLKCTLLPARTPGHDLLSQDLKRIQVKGRVIYNNKTQKVPTIGPSTIEKPWDEVYLVLLDGSYNATEIYRIENELLELHFAQPRLNGSRPLV